MVEKICGKREFWARNETTNAWLRLRVVSRWKINWKVSHQQNDFARLKLVPAKSTLTDRLMFFREENVGGRERVTTEMMSEYRMITHFRKKSGECIPLKQWGRCLPYPSTTPCLSKESALVVSSKTRRNSNLYGMRSFWWNCGIMVDRNVPAPHTSLRPRWLATHNVHLCPASASLTNQHQQLDTCWQVKNTIKRRSRKLTSFSSRLSTAASALHDWG